MSRPFGGGGRRARPPGPDDAERATDAEAAREAALRLLERTRRTRSDLARRLRDQGFAGATSEEVLERLAGVGLVDDVEYARAYLSGRWGRRPSGWRRLEQELRGRGVSSDDIATARERLVEQVGVADETTAARRVIDQAERRYRSLDPRTRQQRLYALLMRRGFDSETIQNALKREPKSV